MNTKLKNEFKGALKFSDVKEKTEHDSKILMFKFLSIIENEMTLKGMSKKELASQLNTSPSYITQLFRGTKTINLMKLAQLQNLFNIEFDIQLVPKFKKKAIRASKKSKPKPVALAR
jgi:transcriptional regulator with XRE-family HTH domain